MIIRRIASLIAIALLSACGGGGGGGTVVPTHQIAAQSGSLVVTLKVPARANQLRPHQKNSLRPMDNSPATMGVGISFALSPASPPPAKTPTVAVNLSTCTSANACTANADGSRTYAITTPPFATGTYNVNIATWDAAPSGGSFASANELSDAATTAAITALNTNINITLNGIPSTVVAVPLEGQSHVFTTGNASYQIIGNVPTQWDVTALDADGYIIAGDGAPNIAFTDTTHSFAETNLNAPSNSYAISVVAAQQTAVTLGFTATGLGPSTAVSTPGSVSILPVQELWTTTTGEGLFGYQLDPTNPNSSVTYAPPYENCCFSEWVYTDQFQSSDIYEAVAQDSAGMLWVYDASTNKLVQFAPSSAAEPAPTGTTISTTGKTIAGLAGDANGFLYAIDTTANQLLVWQVVSTTPTLKFTVTVANAGALGLSIIPNAPTGIPSGAAGVVLISDSGGVDIYTNASGGTPTHITTQAGQFGETAAYSTSVSPDNGTVWVLDQSYNIGYYTLSAGPVLVQGSSIPSEDDENGAIAAAIAGYVFTANGSDGYYDYQYYLQGGSVYPGIELNNPSSDSYGVVVSP